MDLDLRGRTAVVTGASRGIGAAIARTLAACGADIGIGYRREAEAASAVAADIRAHGRRVALLPGDLRERDTCLAIAAAATEELGPIDILVHNAGVGPRGLPAAEVSWRELNSLMDIHCWAGVHLCQALVPAMREAGRGDVVLVTAAVPFGGQPSLAPYAMAKAAVTAFAQCMAHEERAHGIRVNVVRPGFTETDMAKGLLERMAGTGDFRTIDAAAPFGRVERPEDIADIVAFLVSPAGGYITNQVIDVDGGQSTISGGRLPVTLDWANTASTRSTANSLT